jgi:diguanylate cyclase (GGDEF)-like protein
MIAALLPRRAAAAVLAALSALVMAPPAAALHALSHDAAASAPATAAARAAEVYPPGAYQRLLSMADDDPTAALAHAASLLLASPDAPTRFWIELASSHAYSMLEDLQAQAAALARAGSALALQSAPNAHLKLWLELAKVSAGLSSQAPQHNRELLTRLKPQIQALGSAALSCTLLSVELWALIDASSLDEAWINAEALERCARQDARLQRLEVIALSAMGQIVSEGSDSTAAGANTEPPGKGAEALRAVAYFERSLAALRDQPARFRRSVIAWDLGNTYRRSRQLTPALAQLRRALELSQSLNDRAGIAAAQIDIARIQLELGAVDVVPPLLAEAQKLLDGFDNGFRMVVLHQLRIQALARLKRHEVLAEIAAARHWDRETLQPKSRAALARAMAEGYASAAQPSRAYAEMMRAHELDASGRTLARDTQVLRLQARYDTTRREAENAELRHREETARLELDVQRAHERSLWAALATLLVLFTGGGTWAWRGLARRRKFADLALKDELTGAPNRRAVSAYAQAQLDQSRSLAVPLALAMIDLDHFKTVNDRHGHAVGDALLRAFAAAAEEELRGQDRVGRWGGEEWLLVMPGAPLDEMPKLFARLSEAFARAQIAGMPSPHGCTFSMGAAAWRPGINTLDALVARADAQLYLAKAQGRNTVRVAS